MGPRPIIVVGSITAGPPERQERPAAVCAATSEEEFGDNRCLNQAVAIRRLGGTARIVLVADSDLEQRLSGQLVVQGVDITWIRTSHRATGEERFAVTSADADALRAAVAQASVCLLHLGLPHEVVEHMIRLCREHDTETILDTAPIPAEGVPDSLFSADIISPNETEASLLTGLDAAKSPQAAAAALHKRGCRSVVIKLGRHGAYVFSPDGESAVPGYAIDAVDPTAAGDAFSAALAVARSWGWRLAEGIRFANAAGALVCTRVGALSAIPTQAEVEAFLASQP